MEPVQGLPQKRQKTVLTVSASLVPRDAGGAAASGTHCAVAEVGEPKSQLCTAAAAAPLLVLEGVSAKQWAESPVHAPLPASVMAHASANIEHPIAVGCSLGTLARSTPSPQAHLSIADPGTVRHEPRASSDAKQRVLTRSGYSAVPAVPSMGRPQTSRSRHNPPLLVNAMGSSPGNHLIAWPLRIAAAKKGAKYQTVS